MKEEYSPLTMPVLTDKTFTSLARFIQGEYGIKMPPVKKVMLQSRLHKRLKLLGFHSFDAYCDFLFSPAGKAEIVEMINAVSTNKTDFFREPAHFDYLVEHVLPKFRDPFSTSTTRMFNVWSAGCSTGEEPYTLAMVLMDYALQMRHFQFKIMATDISTRVLAHARKAVYTERSIAPVPVSLRKKYMMRSKDRSKGQIRMHPVIREKITFQRMNFMDDSFNLPHKFDIIFCRNVVIYFDLATQEKLFRKFVRQLRPNGFLFIGHSETLNGLDLPFRVVFPTVYQKTE